MTQLIRSFLTYQRRWSPVSAISSKSHFTIFSCYSEDAWPWSSNALLAGARQQRNLAGCQSYLQRCLNLHSPSRWNQKLPNSGPDNELKSTLNTAPHPQDLWEQHPVRASATNITALLFHVEETRNIEGHRLRVNSLQSPSRTFPPDFKFGAHSPSLGFQFGGTVSTSCKAHSCENVTEVKKRDLL